MEPSTKRVWESVAGHHEILATAHGEDDMDDTDDNSSQVAGPSRIPIERDIDLYGSSDSDEARSDQEFPTTPIEHYLFGRFRTMVQDGKITEILNNQGKPIKSDLIGQQYEDLVNSEVYNQTFELINTPEKTNSEVKRSLFRFFGRRSDLVRPDTTQSTLSSPAYDTAESGGSPSDDAAGSYAGNDQTVTLDEPSVEPEQ